MRSSNRSQTSASGPKLSDAEVSQQLLKRKVSFADFISKPPPPTPTTASVRELFADAVTVEGMDSMDLLASALFLPQSIHVSNHAESPIDNVRRLLEASSTPTSSSDSEASQPAPLFCEMLYLSTVEEDEDELDGLTATAMSSPFLWQQTNRWIKYEQAIEGDGSRFSKPHITLLTVHSLLQVKNCFKRGVVLLDIDAADFGSLVWQLINQWIEVGFLDEENVNLVRNVLCAPKFHLVKKKMRKIDEDTSEEAMRERRGSTQLKAIGLKPLTYVRKYSAGGNSDGFEEQEDEEPDKHEDANTRLMKKLPPDTDAAVILVANVASLSRPLSGFVRLREATLLYPQVPDLPLPVKFLYVLLNRVDNYQSESVGIGRAIGALLSDEIFQKVAYITKERHTLVDSIEEFISQIVAIPPGKCHPDARWDPRDSDTSEIRNVGMLYANYENHGDELTLLNEATTAAEHAAIHRTGRLFGGLALDVTRKAPWFISDFTDFFHGRLSQSLAATTLIFFANISNIITFGAVMERALNHQIAAIENIVCGGISGVIFGLLAGQPLNVLSATGPTLVFEKILYDFCTANHWEFLPFRFWVGVWIALFLLILVATDASVLVGLITRFTEEAFATLISIVFIIQAFEKLYEISHEAPITRHPEAVLHSSCHCIIGGGNGSVAPKNISVGVTRCKELGGTPQGLQCFFKPDIYLFSILLTLGTFYIASKLNCFRRSPYLSSRLRNLISDFGVLIAIVVMTTLTYFIGLEVPSLKVPSTFRPTMDRSWIVDVADFQGIHVPFIAALPAVFYTILIAMDQQITAVIVNRRDNKLRKGAGYHLDLLIVAALVLLCSLLGLPFYVAATVLSVMHLDSLKLQKDSVAPGEKPKFLGIKEQRVTMILSHALIGMSVMLTPLVKLVPLPVLTGIFLYMGVTSLLGQQFIQRVALLFTPVKYMPSCSWLRLVRMRRVHLFTTIQLLSIFGLFAVKYASTVSMMFPLMLVVMVLIRMHLLSRIFTAKELQALDDQLPNFRDVWNPKKISKAANDLPFNHTDIKLSKLNGGNGVVDGEAKRFPHKNGAKGSL